jgi:tetratricopeptide (TPR) repeat protein
MAAVLIMVKDEAPYIEKTLDSARDVSNSFVILDTGSTDDTPTVIRRWCEKHGKNLHIFKSSFVNFEVSRNELLARADAIIKRENWYLLLDANDEFRGDLASILATATTEDGIYLQQVWNFGTERITYQNCRCIRARAGWRYKGVVHEYLHKEGATYLYARDRAHIYQDRTVDAEKSAARFVTDYSLLLKEVEKNPTDARSTFYLARTCEALGARDEAIKWFKRRAEMGDFLEEVFHSYLSIGQLQRKAGRWRGAIQALQEAYQADARVEPLLELAEIHRERSEWQTAYMYLDMALTLVPEERLLFYDPRKYEYTRWHLMGIVAYYAGAMTLGRFACEKAVKASVTDEERALNASNLSFYL